MCITPSAKVPVSALALHILTILCNVSTVELLSFVLLPHFDLPGFYPVQVDTAASGRHLALDSSNPSGSTKHASIGNKFREESKTTPYRPVAVDGYWNYSRSLDPAWYTSLMIPRGSWSLGHRATIPSSLPASTTMDAISNSDIRTVSDGIHSPFRSYELSTESFPWNADEARMELVAGMGCWADEQPGPNTRQQAVSEAASRRQPREANGGCGDNSGSRNKRRWTDNDGSDEGNDGGGLNRGNGGDGDEGHH